MRLTLRRLREKKGWTLDTASKIFGISRSKLKEYEEYKDIPTYEELKTILKITGFYFDEIGFIILRDIESHYKGNKWRRIWYEFETNQTKFKLVGRKS